jgi:acyl-CoA hydrolase
MIKDNRFLSFQFISEPTDVNFGGKVHGGQVMKWIDQTAYACASHYASNYCVTVYVGGIRFYKPIAIGAIVKVDARVVYTGRTSIHIAVDVFSREVRSGEFNKTTHCVIVFVSVDEEGNPIPVPPLILETEEEVELANYAKRLIDLRKSIDSEMKRFL